MTSLMDPRANAPWTSMPGWGIVADLTPPELIAARGLRTLRRILVLALVLVVLICVAGYVFVRGSDNGAHDQLDAANAQTAQLTAERSKYAVVTQVQNATQSIRAELVTLFASDIDAAIVLAHVQDALPKGMSFTSITVSPTTASVGTDPSDPTLVQVGTITISGTSIGLNDLPLYAAALGHLKGFTDIIPTSNSKGSKSVSWTVTAGLTSDLLTHRYSASGDH
jgi:type IV pilus assembly protein PilN